MKAVPFEQFVGIDWSGEREVAGGIQVAQFDAKARNPKIVTVGNRHWRRSDVLQYLKSLKNRTIVGIDFAFSVPWSFEGPWPDNNGNATDVRSLWASVDKLCINETELFAGPVWLSQESPFRPFIRHHATEHTGFLYDRKRFRKTEEIASHRPISVYHMTGAQVGQGSFAGMRLLHALRNENEDVAVWPFSSPEESKIVIVEVYPSLFYSQADRRRPRRKDTDDVFYRYVEQTLAHFGVRAGYQECGRSVDKADALVTAAALSCLAGLSQSFLVPHCRVGVAAREGWIFGVFAGGEA